MIEIRAINATYAVLNGDVPPQVSSVLYNRFSYKMKNFDLINNQYKKRFGKNKFGKWDGWFHLFDINTNKFYAGFVPIIERSLIKAGLPVINLYDVDAEIIDDNLIIDTTQLKLKPRRYQLEAAEWAIDTKRCIIESATSSGKTFVAFMIVNAHVQAGHKVLCVVPRKHLVSQMEKDFDSYFNSDISWFSKYGDRFTLVTWQAIEANRKKWDLSRYDCVIVDEVHLAKAKSLKKTIESCTNAYYRVGMTGTLDESQVDNLLLTGLFGRKHKFVTNKSLIGTGYAAPVEIKFVHIIHEDCDGWKAKVSNYQSEIEYLAECLRRNIFIANNVVKNGGNAFVMTRQLNHAYLLKKLIEKFGKGKLQVFVLDGNSSLKERTKVFSKFDKNDNVVLVATFNLISTGLSINNVKFLHIALPIKSYISYMQSIGRVLRKHKDKKAVVYDYVDHVECDKLKCYSEEHGQARLMYIIDEDLPITESEVRLDECG